MFADPAQSFNSIRNERTLCGRKPRHGYTLDFNALRVYTDLHPPEVTIFTPEAHTTEQYQTAYKNSATIVLPTLRLQLQRALTVPK